MYITSFKNLEKKIKRLSDMHCDINKKKIVGKQFTWKPESKTTKTKTFGLR